MTNYRIWMCWTDRSEVLVDLRAVDADAALESAVRRGLVSGLGTRKSYLGLHAVVTP